MFLSSQSKFLHITKKCFRNISLSTALQGFDPKIPVEEAFTPPNSWYTSQEFYQKEIENIWKKNWVCADGFLNFKEAGDFKTGNLANQPYILMQSKDVIKAFYNVCLHHGSVIETNPEGKCEQLQCPYHGWTYNIDGQLIKCASMKGIKNFKLKENKLKEINSFHYGNLCFLNLNQNAKVEEIKTTMGNFEKAHLEKKIDPKFEKLHFVMKKDYVINCNWKIFVDNWLDGGYHVPILHKNLNKEIEMKQYLITNHHKLNLQEAPGSQSDRIGDYAIYSYVFPNTMIARYGPWLDISLIFPLAVDKCLVTMKWFVSPEKKDDQKFIEDSLKSSYEIQEEDIYISQLVMQGVSSDGYYKGRYSPLKESGMHCFHKQIHQELSQ